MRRLTLPSLLLSSALTVCGNASAAPACTQTAPAPLANPPSVQVSIAPANLCNNTVPIPDTFAGLMLPMSDITTVIGNINGLNPQFSNLLRNLTMYKNDSRLRIRIGNDTLMWTGANSPHKDRIPALARLAGEFNVSYLLGVDFKSNNLATTTSAINALSQGLPAHSIEALQLGNEADLYPATTQPNGLWDYNLFAARFAEYTNSVVPMQVGAYGGKVVAPVWASTGSATFFAPFAGTGINPLDRFIADYAGKLGLVDMHTYYGSNCRGVATLVPGDLLKPQAATKLQAIFQPRIAAAHALTPSIPFVLSEWNAASCGGIAGVSDAFESALWVVDSLFEWHKVGLDGVMLTTDNRYAYSPWIFTTSGTETTVRVAPNYYAFRMFLQATQNAARRVDLSLSNPNNSNLKAWATIDAANVVRVVLINKDVNFTDAVDVSLAGYKAPKTYALTAPAYTAKTGVSYAGQTFDDTTDGNPAGIMTAPVTEPTAPGHFAYRFAGVGAVLLEFEPAPTEASLAPSDDAFVRDGGFADNNFGSKEYLTVKEEVLNYDRNTLLKFDLRGVPGMIAGARLRLTPVKANEGIVNQLYQTTSANWTERSVTWNTQPAAGSLLASYNVPLINQPVEIDVTSAAVSAQNGDQQLSLTIRSAANYGSDGRVDYASRTSSNEAARPVLVVSYY